VSATFDLASLAVILGAMLLIGFLIGSIGIGGVLLAPSLVYFGGMGVRESIAISMASFIIPGLVALVTVMRSVASDIPSRWPLLLMTAPGAFLGAVALAFVPDGVALAILAIFMVATGIRVLVGQRVTKGGEPKSGTDGVIGLVTGFLSAMTGTGGPMVMVPILLWSGTLAFQAVALGQVAQLPVASIATGGNLLTGGVNLPLALLFGTLLVPGILLGRKTASVMPLSVVTRVVSTVLIGVGTWLAYSVIRGGSPS
jgi:uncharacterized membrane protein YfcA